MFVFVCESGLWWVCMRALPNSPACVCLPAYRRGGGGWGGVGRYTWALRFLARNQPSPHFTNKLLDYLSVFSCMWWWNATLLLSSLTSVAWRALRCRYVDWQGGERGPVRSEACKMWVLLRGNTLCSRWSSLSAVKCVHCSGGCAFSSLLCWEVQEIWINDWWRTGVSITWHLDREWWKG